MDDQQTIEQLLADNADLRRRLQQAEQALVAALAGVACRAGEDRDLAEMALKKSEGRFRQLLEVSPDALMITRDLRVEYVNPACVKLFAATSETMLGAAALDLIHPDYHALVIERINSMIKTGNPVPLIEEKIIRFDGSTGEVEIAAAPIHDEKGTAIVVSLRDISERKRLEARLLRAQRLESVGTLVGGIAHDLNNVLTPILMTVKLLKKKERSEESRQRLLATAEASVDHGVEMVKQLLSFAGGERGSRAVVQPSSILSEVTILLEHTLPKTVRIKITCAADLWNISADATQLTQVLLNLCINARDAMPQGGTLCIAAENTVVNSSYALTHPEARVGSYVLLTVADTGMGIPPDVLDKIFDPFFTTKEFGKGTGLGLSTALGIVKSHAGFIDVYSEDGKGTRFAVYLPAIQQPQPAKAQELHRWIRTGNGELVLLVDDEPAILVTARVTLEGNGYRVLTAQHGSEAVALFKQHQGEIQVVVLDMMMPVMDGLATLDALQELDPAVRVIAASGLLTTGRVDDAVASGARVFLQKPYSDEQLLSAVGDVLAAETKG